MKTARRRVLSHATRSAADRAADSGLTLIEVLAAVIIIVIVALSGAGLSINGINTAAAQERQQVAVTIANGAMESVSGWSVANLSSGRCQSPVNAAFTANSTKPGVSAMYATWDAVATAAGTCSAPGLPVTLTSTQNGTSYTQTILIGDCYESVTGSDCNVIPGNPTEPTTTPAGYTGLIRIIVLVSWTAGSKCSTTACYYETTALADPHPELSWVSP